MAAAGKAGAAGATAGAHRGSIEEILKDMDLGTPPTSEANIPTLPRPKANPTAPTGRIVVTPGSRSAEVALSRNFHALQQLWKQRDQIAQDERLALRIANEELQARKRASVALPQSGAPTPEPRVDKPGFPRGTVRGGLQVQVPTPTQAETPQVSVGPDVQNLTLHRPFYRHGAAEAESLAAQAAATLMREVPDSPRDRSSAANSRDDMNRAPTPNSALTAQSPLESPPVPAPVPLSPRPPVPQSPRAQAEASVPAPAPVSPRAQSGAASVQDFPSQTIVTSLGGSVPTLPTPLRRGESGRSIASASGPTPGAGSESPTSVSFRKGSLQVTVPADQFARTAVPTSPRSNGSSAPGSAPTSPRGLPASQTAVSLSTVDFRGSGTVRASSLGSSDPQLAAIEAEIREWRKLFRQTYGYYPGVKDVQEDKLKKGIKKKLEMYRIIRTKNLMFQGKTTR